MMNHAKYSTEHNFIHIKLEKEGENRKDKTYNIKHKKIDCTFAED